MADSTTIPVELTADRQAIDAALDLVSRELLHDVAPPVADAVRYALQGPGKRLRGILVAHAYAASGGAARPWLLAAAVEVVHTYSLVHDDLPCMDDDDMRRGRPTTHIEYGVATATTAGVVMIPLAVRCVTRAAREMGLPPRTAALITETLMYAAGASGMIGGQLRDIRAEGQMLTLDDLETIHRTKTGALIAASARIGGLAAGASPAALEALSRYGADLGLAFQIVDDVLDVTSTSAHLGKTAGRDAMLGKSTYPSLLGVEQATERARTLVAHGRDALAQAGLLTGALTHFADLVITRTH